MGNSVSKKFGSRILSDEEVKLTLPTYDKLLEQIDDMRKEEWDEDKSKKLHNQKINNISILGARGTGKTSILKSLINKLEEENKEDVILGKNIVLPMIVPENMSTSSNLMSMILGLFKGIVDELEAKEESRSKECWFSKESDISKRYRELVRKFCFLQPDFKSVPIKQYTTENDYVEKSSQIFQADIEFMSYFNDFIDMLIETKEEKNERLIFVFIDDMDLSTQRCVDAVRTLLAYISHPRIVTVLAGDLETFEEALTLDFIRQEQMVNADIFKTNFVVANGEKDEYLERKKALTYEYLKKVMPVIYRHNLREWSLETRGNYIVKGNAGNKWNKDGNITEEQKFDKVKEENNKKLVELLHDCFNTLENPPIFQYFENEEGEGKNLPQMFHIFDHTARGLNAVYNVLLDTHYIMQNGEKDKKIPQIKILLETIVGSNSLFNKYRKVIFDDIIKFGNDYDDTCIDCENFKKFIIEEFKIRVHTSIDKKDAYLLNKINDDMVYSNVVEIFSLFALIDFSIRILKKTEIFSDEAYIELKKFNAINLINNPEISGVKIPQRRVAVFDEANNIILDKKIENKDIILMSKIILKLLSDMDFGYAITLFHFLSENNNYIFEEIAGDAVSLVWAYRKTICLYEMVKSVDKYKDRSEKNSGKLQTNSTLEGLIKQFEKEFSTLLIFIHGGKGLSQILKMILDELFDSIEFGKNLSYCYWYREIFCNTLAESRGNGIFYDESFAPLSEMENDYKALFRVNTLDYKRILLIIAIDKNHLWGNDISINVKEYIRKELEKLLKEIKCSDENKVDISCFKDVLIKFEDSYKGKRDTRAKEFEDGIKELLKDRENFEIEFSKFNALESKIRAFISSRAWYGKDSAFEMLKELQNAKLISITNQIKKGVKEENKEKEHKYFIKKLYAYIHMYVRCTYNEEKNMIWISKEITAFKNDIYDCSMISEGNKIKSVYDLLATDVDEEVVSKFEELFPSKGE